MARVAEAQRAGVPLGVTTPEDIIHVEKCVLFLNEIFVSRLLQCGVARVWHWLLGLWILPGVGTTWFTISTPCSYTAFSPEFRVQPHPQQNFQRKRAGKDPNLLGN